MEVLFPKEHVEIKNFNTGDACYLIILTEQNWNH